MSDPTASAPTGKPSSITAFQRGSCANRGYLHTGQPSQYVPQKERILSAQEADSVLLPAVGEKNGTRVITQEPDDSYTDLPDADDPEISTQNES